MDEPGATDRPTDLVPGDPQDNGAAPALAEPVAADPALGFEAPVAEGGGTLANARSRVEDGIGHLGSLLRGIKVGVQVLAMGVLLIGLLAVGLGLAAFHGSVLAVVFVVLVAIPAIIGPLYFRRRVSALVDAASHPAEVADEARDLLGRVRQDGAGLGDLANRLRGAETSGGGANPIARRSKLVRAVGIARAASGVLGMFEPDSKLHPHLVPLRPERVRSLWWWLIISAIGLPLATVLIVASIIALAASAL